MTRNVLRAAVIIVIAVVLIGAVWYTESHKQSPERRAVKQFQETHKLSDDADSSSSDDADSNEKNKDDGTVFFSEGLMYKPLSYTIMSETDPRLRTDYQKVYYADGKYPDPDYKVDDLDIEGLKKASPELKDLYEHDEDYTYAESEEIFNRNADLLKEYTISVHPKTRYLFITMDITNTKDVISDSYLALYIADENADMTDNLVYFDKAVHISSSEEDRKSFRLYRYKPGETIQTTIGFALREDRIPEESKKLYVGFPAGGASGFMDEKSGFKDGENVVCLDDLDEIK